MLSVVIPTYAEASLIGDAVRCARAIGNEVVVADGGSFDATREEAERSGARVVLAPKGRGPQQRAGARIAHGDVLLFLHADCRLPPRARDAITATLARPGVGAGSFRVRFSPTTRAALAFGAAYHLQRRMFGLEYGDCGLFVDRRWYERAGGHPPLPLMEDHELLRRLRRLCGVVLVEDVVISASGRRFAERPLRTALQYAALQSMYLCGLHPRAIASLYADSR